jgi:hypothetical protein
MELETRLQVAERSTGRPGQLPPAVQQMLDSALAASNAKLQQLKKTHYHLLEQHTELQMRLQDLEGERQAEQGRFHFPDKALLDFEKQNISRSSSTNVRPAKHMSPRYLPQLSTETTSEDREYIQSPEMTSSPISPARATRGEPASRPQRTQTTPLPYPGFGGAFVPDYHNAYDTSLDAHLQSQKQGSAPQSSNQSSYSVDTADSTGKEKKDKVAPKSEVRVYGRGE